MDSFTHFVRFYCPKYEVGQGNLALQKYGYISNISGLDVRCVSEYTYWCFRGEEVRQTMCILSF